MEITESQISECQETWGINKENKMIIERKEIKLNEMSITDTENWNKVARLSEIKKTENSLKKEFSKRKRIHETFTITNVSDDSKAGKSGDKIESRIPIQKIDGKPKELSKTIEKHINEMKETQLRNTTYDKQIEHKITSEFNPIITSTPIKREKRNIFGINELDDDGFLDGEIINSALEMLVDTHNPENTALFSFRYVHPLTLNNFELPLRHLHEKNVMQKENLLAMFNTNYERDGFHWFLVDIQFKQKEVRIFNSMPTCPIPKETFKAINNLLIATHVTSNVNLDINQYKISQIENTPSQIGSECGMCVLQNAKCILQNQSLTEIQNYRQSRNSLKQKLLNYNFRSEEDNPIEETYLKSMLEKCEKLNQQCNQCSLEMKNKVYTRKELVMENQSVDNDVKINETQMLFNCNKTEIKNKTGGSETKNAICYGNETLMKLKNVKDKKDKIELSNNKVEIFHESICKTSSNDHAKKRKKRNVSGIEKLDGSGYLSIDVVSSAIEMHTQKLDNKKTTFFHSHNLQGLYHNNFDVSIRHLYKNKVLEKDNMIFAINTDYEEDGSHWFLCDWNFNNNCIRLFDSLSCKIPNNVFNIIKNLIIVTYVTNNCSVELEKFKIHKIKDTPLQEHFECGICVVENAKSILKETKLHDTNVDYRQLRKKLKMELETFNFPINRWKNISNEKLSEIKNKCNFYQEKYQQYNFPEKKENYRPKIYTTIENRQWGRKCCKDCKLSENWKETEGELIMIQCKKCRTWYHSECVSQTVDTLEKSFKCEKCDTLF
ncbi:UNVERIFIED_CONTAM: hypothetical protein RMT77_012758 [Armadillidium vulgare]